MSKRQKGIRKAICWLIGHERRSENRTRLRTDMDPKALMHVPIEQMSEYVWTTKCAFCKTVLDESVGRPLR